MSIPRTSLIKLGEFSLPKNVPGTGKGIMNNIGRMLKQDIAKTAGLIGIKSTIDTSSREQIRMIVSEALECIKPEFHNTSVVDLYKETVAIEANLEIIRHKFQKVMPELEVKTLLSQINKNKARQGMDYIDITREYLEANLRGHMWVMINSEQHPIEFKTSEEVAEMIKEERNRFGKILPGIMSASLVFGASFAFFVSKHDTFALGAISLGIFTLPFLVKNAIKYRDFNALYRFFQEQEGLITVNPKHLKDLQKIMEVTLLAFKQAKNFELLEHVALDTTGEIADAKVDKYNKRKFYVELLQAIVEAAKREEMKDAFLPMLFGDIEDSISRIFPAKEDRVAIFVESGATAKRPVSGNNH